MRRRQRVHPLSPNGGATGSLLYSIDGGLTRSTTTDFTGLGAGAYAVLVENDDAACPTVLDTTVVLAATAQPVISAALVEDNASCASRSGQISLEVTNATEATRYRINAGPWQSAPLFTGLNADDYRVEARDTVSGCTTVVDSLVTVAGRKLVPGLPGRYAATLPAVTRPTAALRSTYSAPTLRGSSIPSTGG